MSDKPKKRGRPSKYKPEYCQTVIEIMSQGKSMSAVAAEIGVGVHRLIEWSEDNEDFREACDTGRALALRWWENLATMVATGQHEKHDVFKKANAGMIMFLMSRRFQEYYNKSAALVAKDGGENKLPIVFETQLLNGVVRQDIKNLSGNNHEQVIDVMVRNVVDEACREN